jgi:hypothetical protein
LDAFKSKGRDCKLHQLDHLDLSEVYATAMYNYGDIVKTQQPHVDYSWEVLLLDSKRSWHGLRLQHCSGLKGGYIPYASMHMPLTPEGSYIFVWFGRGQSCPIFVRYDHILCLRGDVVHCGGLPPLGNGVRQHIKPKGVNDCVDHQVRSCFWQSILGQL